MTVWIVLSIILVVLSPLAWLKPSRRQSGRMAARLEARRLGVAMQLVPQQWPHWLQAAPPGTCAQYAVPRQLGRMNTWCYWQAQPGLWVNQWREPCECENLLQVFSQWPADVWKAEANHHVVAVYWGEQGDPKAIAAGLRALA
ncbi:hypothetical protein [Pseudomonas typographi]|uniref:hypothetical protein n=1 Tax=Pseudomonas typographi TaxID=2715964 RepID=UPI0016840B54|nr:hypothetical protein [Pseudomonas typographi]MBD1553226.1 hypothetical protein [Pseudomonas typographi]MBD1588106.1 hypothetical protein [Pseudomonas typographi]